MWLMRNQLPDSFYFFSPTRELSDEVTIISTPPGFTSNLICLKGSFVLQMRVNPMVSPLKTNLTLGLESNIFHYSLPPDKEPEGERKHEINSEEN